MMRKIFIILFGISFIILLFWLNLEKELDYDDYENMELLSTKSKSQLENEGYSKVDIEKIKVFDKNYQNHLSLVNMIENNTVKHYGYNNRIIEEHRKIIYEKNDFTKQHNHLMFNTIVMDLARDEERDAARIIIEFEWNNKPSSNRHAINVTYNNFIMKNIYTALKYVDSKDQNDIVYKMAELEPVNFLDGFYTDFDSRKRIDGKNYVLTAGIIVLDVRSYIVGKGIAPLSITSRYVTKPLIGSQEILSEQVIVNAGNEI